MPNKNYLAGVRFEREVKKKYEDLGYSVIRASGSHGLFDIVAIHPKFSTILLIQCKRVEKLAQLLTLEKKWKQGSPFPPLVHSQILAVKVKGTHGFEEIWA